MLSDRFLGNTDHQSANANPTLSDVFVPSCRCSNQTEGSGSVGVLPLCQDRTHTAEGMLRLHVLHHVAWTRPDCQSLPYDRANAGRPPTTQPIPHLSPFPQLVLEDELERGPALQVQQSCLSREPRTPRRVQSQDLRARRLFPVFFFFRLFLYIHSTCKFLPHQRSFLPLVFSFLLIINKHSLAASSELIGRNEPNLVVYMSCFPDRTTSGERQQDSRKQPATRHDVCETSYSLSALPLSALMSFLMITAGCRWRSVGSL